jgi:adenylosuccinate synthase
MLRIGKLARNYIDKKYLWNEKLEGNILCEGAQSFWLDINYGDYPYVTSSETLPYSACSLGFSPKLIRDIIGVTKIYDTKSGVDPLFPESLWQDEELNMIIELGKEFGSTTGRKRIVNWLNLNKLIDAIKISGVTKLIINKCDILEQMNTYKLYQNNSLYKFHTLEAMQSFIKSYLNYSFDNIEIIFSGDQSKI